MWQIPNMWDKERCWIIGGGVSFPKQFGVPDDMIDKVTSGELSPYAYLPWMKSLQGEHVIGTNMAYLLGELVDVLLFGDSPFFRTHHVGINAFPGLKVSCAQLRNDFREHQKNIQIINKNVSRFGIDIAKRDRIRWNSHTGGAAISLAASLGVKEIYLLGFDMTADEKGRTHWHGEYKHQTKQKTFDNFQKSFQVIVKDAKKLGIKIVNVNPDSAIKQFPKVTFQTVLQHVKSQKPQNNRPIGMRQELSVPYKGDLKDKGKGGMHKYEILSLFHEIYNPQLYFEIGVDRGVSIRLAKCKTIGVDPKPTSGGNANEAEIHVLKSDKFFEKNLLNGRVPDLVFIDGLHHFDQVIRDFRNTEKNCKRNTIIVIDDILPSHTGQTTREWKPGAWTGDVWKVIPILKKYRPDLKIILLDSNPTGLMEVTNLDCENTILWDDYDAIVKEWMNTEVPDYIVNREKLDVRKDIEEQVRNFGLVEEKKILCFVNHYYNPDQKEGFKGGSTVKNPKREEIVKKVIERVKSIPGCDVKVCGFTGYTVPGVTIDIDFTKKGVKPHHLVYESLNKMKEYVGDYDYFINVEDDIYIPNDVINNVIQFDRQVGINEILLPNRIEKNKEGDWKNIDLEVVSGWTKLGKMYNQLRVKEALNRHSGILIMNTEKFQAVLEIVNPDFRDVWYGGPMASAFAYFHSPFILYRNFHPTRFHSVYHLDQWTLKRNNRGWIQQEKREKRRVPPLVEGEQPEVTGLCVVYNTKESFEKAYDSIRFFHPTMFILIIDGSEKENSCYEYVKGLQSQYTKVIQLERNIGHGRGMDMGLKQIETPYALIFDSDIEMLQSPVSKMINMMEEDTYGIGWIYNIGMDGKDWGYLHPVDEPQIPYLHPYFQLINIKSYKEYHPYVHHGAPCYLAMIDIFEKGKSDKILKKFPGLTGHSTYPFKPWRPIPSQYVEHEFGKTRHTNIAAGELSIKGVRVNKGRNMIEAKIPYGLNGDLAGAYNSNMESAATNWVLLMDQDVFLCNPYWYEMCIEAINFVDNSKVGLITCTTSFLDTHKGPKIRSCQIPDREVGTSNIEEHIDLAKELYQKHGIKLQKVTSYKIAGFFMLVNKSIWEEVKFKSINTGVQGIDWNFCKRLLDQGYQIYEMPGLYVFHRRGMRKMNWKKSFRGKDAKMVETEILNR